MSETEVLLKLYEFLANGDYTAVFWSGFRDHGEAARAICQGWGGNYMALEMMLENCGVDLAQWESNPEFWPKVSDVLSRYFRGNYRVIAGPNAWHGSIYNLVERLGILNNSHKGAPTLSDATGKITEYTKDFIPRVSEGGKVVVETIEEAKKYADVDGDGNFSNEYLAFREALANAVDPDGDGAPGVGPPDAAQGFFSRLLQDLKALAEGAVLFAKGLQNSLAPIALPA